MSRALMRHVACASLGIAIGCQAPDRVPTGSEHVDAGSTAVQRAADAGGSAERDAAERDAGRAGADAQVVEAAVDAMAAAWPVRSVAAGEWFTCATRLQDRSVRCWGDDRDGVVSDAPEDVAFATLAAGDFHVCGLRQDDGLIECWGADGGEGLTDPPKDVAMSALALGSHHGCAIGRDDGRLRCWGASSEGRLDAPEGSFRLVASGADHTCATRSDDDVTLCWGSGYANPTIISSTPYDQLFTGATFSCGLRSADSAVECFGKPDFDVFLGIANMMEPVVPSTPIAFDQVSSSRYHICGILQLDHTVRCWDSRELYGDTDGNLSRTPVQMPMLHISVGSVHNCGVREEDLQLHCWGSHGDKVWGPNTEHEDPTAQP